MRQVDVNGWIVSSRRNDALGLDDALDVGGSADKSLGVNEAEEVVSKGSSARSETYSGCPWQNNSPLRPRPTLFKVCPCDVSMVIA